MIYVLIPALLRDANSEQRLLRTLARLPAGASATLVLVTQGNRMVVPTFPGVCAVIHEHFDTPLGKWAAIKHGLSRIPSSSNDPLMLIDADDPITDASVVKALAILNSSQHEFVIGNRNNILLHADDQLSPQSRVFVEIFSNTLLLLTLQTRQPLPSIGPDIQSGLYLLSNRARRALSLSYVKDYGGELALYYELTNSGFVASDVSVETNTTTPSSYSVEKIVQSIAELPFFRAVPGERLSEALHLAPRLYARFLRQGTENQFRLELIAALRGVFSDFARQIK